MLARWLASPRPAGRPSLVSNPVDSPWMIVTYCGMLQSRVVKVRESGSRSTSWVSGRESVTVVVPLGGGSVSLQALRGGGPCGQTGGHEANRGSARGSGHSNDSALCSTAPHHTSPTPDPESHKMRGLKNINCSVTCMMAKACWRPPSMKRGAGLMMASPGEGTENASQSLASFWSGLSPPRCSHRPSSQACKQNRDWRVSPGILFVLD